MSLVLLLLEDMETQYWKVESSHKPDDDGVDVLVSALYPRQAPHPDHVGIDL